MNYEDRWEQIKMLGEGGQGKVFLARKRRGSALDEKRKGLLSAMREITSSMRIDHGDGSQERACDNLVNAIENLRKPDDPDQLAALKVLHRPQDSRDPERAADRIRREMEAMRGLCHPTY